MDEERNGVGDCLRVIYEPPKDNSNPIIDIVAVHGLHSTYTKTWCMPDEEIEGLGPLLCQFSSSARVFAFDGDIQEGTVLGESGLEKTAASLLESISTREDKKRPLVFLCHNVAGIIVKELLWIANHDENYMDIALATRALVCFGTPDSSCDWNDVLFRLILATTDSNAHKDTIAHQKERKELIDRGANALSAACARYDMIKNQYEIVSIFEELPTVGIGIVVTCNQAKESHILLRATHNQLCNIDLLPDDVVNTVIQSTATEKKAYQYSAVACRQALASFCEQDGNPGEMTPGPSSPITYQFYSDLHERGRGITTIYGSAGSGKSVLASQISTANCFDDKNIIVLSYYFNAGDYRRSSYHNLLLSFNLQLLYWGDTPFDSEYVQGVYTRMRISGNASATMSPDLYQLLCGMLKRLSSFEIIFVIDALDECDEGSRGQLIGDLRRLMLHISSSYKVFITCQPTDSIVALLGPFEESDSINLDEHLEEVTKPLLCNERFADIRHRLSGVGMTPLLINLVSVLYQQKGANKIPEHLDYNTVYEQIMTQIDAPELWLRQVLLSVAFAKRPLAVCELAGAIWMEPDNMLGNGQLTLQRIRIGAPKNLEEDLRFALYPLIRVDNGFVRFMHGTLRDFVRNWLSGLVLDHNLEDKSAEGRSYMLQKCLDVLSIPEVRGISGFPTKRRPFDTLCDPPISERPHSFAFYAGSCLATHLAENAKDGDNNDWFTPAARNSLSLFIDNVDARSWWLQKFIRVQAEPSPKDDSTTPDEIFHYSVSLGCQSVIRILLPKIHEKSSIQSAFFTALRCGYVGTAQVLYQAANSDNDLWLSAFEIACQSGHTELVVSIISWWPEGIEQLSKKKLNDCLHLVAKYGYWDIISKLRVFLPDLMRNIERDKLKKLFEVAAENGRDGVVSELLLLHKDAGYTNDIPDKTAQETLDTKEGNEEGDSDHIRKETWLTNALFKAAEFGSAACIYFLAPHLDLEYARGAWRWTALHHATMENMAEAVEQLLDSGADIECQDGQDATPLLLACLGEQMRTVRVLLDRGANPDHIATDSANYRALHIAARQGNEPLVRVLLEAGSSENARLKKPMWDTPLHLAIYHSQNDTQYAQTVNTLLEFGADVDALNGNNMTPLHIVIKESKDENIAKSLVRFGANIDKLDGEDYSPLYYAIKENSPMASILWDPRGIMKDRGVSVLFAAASQGKVLRVQQLLKAGYDKTEQDSWGRTAFDVASNLDVRELLAPDTPVATGVAPEEWCPFIAKKSYHGSWSCDKCGMKLENTTFYHCCVSSDCSTGKIVDFCEPCMESVRSEKDYEKVLKRFTAAWLTSYEEFSPAIGSFGSKSPD
ncbi:uncharacterized protein GGS22DRAFT_158880 [Annulohypoxylon maeteangense]|uniref:uncharacterized protein n=1 Tax=Annulohypoxylon maeteangense TaxID=1927788 RepID=UPI002007F9E6|nr:uncharacterized protein GGS22DRAFT_158880 [Annulohypoxylon maeteangense]KAI0886863.1 hypothetical protein GGS22DRAFT_158880 [Annulohypoxylon maeteangense]